MRDHTTGELGRRRFLQRGIAAGIGFGILECSGHAAHRALQPHAEDAPNTHNMLVVGEQAAFLSHLPMFQRVDQVKSEFTSPHRYQVILQAMFRNGEKDVTDVYLKDRRNHPGTRIYTLGPEEEFVLPRLFPSEASQPALTSFTATVFRGHLEHDGTPVPGLERTRVNVTRVAHARKFDPRATKPDRLEYLVFGRPTELFLAHAIFAPPDFDHVVAVTLSAPALTDTDSTTDMRIVFADRANVASERIREGQEVAGTLRRAGDRGGAGTAIKVQVTRQHYFEEGELLVPPTSQSTLEEKKGE